MNTFNAPTKKVQQGIHLCGQYWWYNVIIWTDATDIFYLLFVQRIEKCSDLFIDTCVTSEIRHNYEITPLSDRMMNGWQSYLLLAKAINHSFTSFGGLSHIIWNGMIRFCISSLCERNFYTLFALLSKKLVSSSTFQEQTYACVTINPPMPKKYHGVAVY